MVITLTAIPALILANTASTGVGNTHGIHRGRSANTVHPHRCGEHWYGFCYCCFGDGSSPQVWGTPEPDQQYINRVRFIPTGVGNTRTRSTIYQPCSVHPHRCGEHPRQWQTIKNNIRFIPTGVGNTTDPPCSVLRISGSSPQVWGTHHTPISEPHQCRFIPTGVGNTY